MQKKFEEFLQGCRSSHTKTHYYYSITKVLGENPDDFLSQSKDSQESHLIKWILQNKSKVGGATIKNQTTAVRSFLEYCDVKLNWKKIKRLIPTFSQAANDRAPTVQEINQLLTACDKRDRAVVLLYASSGMRLGGLCGLKIRDYQKVETEAKDGKKINVGKLIVYRDDMEQYTTFCTPEGVEAIDAYLDSRKKTGEELKGNSPLFRLWFDEYKGNTKVAPINDASMSRYMMKLWERSGVRTRDADAKRKEFKANHGFRKFFETQLIGGGMTEPMVKKLLGQTNGLAASYYKPEEKKKLDEYVKHIDQLYITEQYRVSDKLEEIDRKIELNRWESALVYAKAVGDISKSPDELIQEHETVLGRKMTMDEKTEYLEGQVEVLALIRQIPPGQEQTKPAKLLYPLKRPDRKERDIVGEDKLLKTLADGYEIERELSNGKFLVKLAEE